MKKYYIGEIVKTQGIKGEVRIKLYDGYQNNFKNFEFFYIDNDEKLVIKKHRFKKNLAIVKFEGLDDINEAEKLIQKKVYLYKKDIVLEPGEFIIEDVIGFEAYDGETKIGVLKDIDLHQTSQGVFILKTDQGELLVPLHVNFIKNIDMKNKRLNFRNTEGLRL